MDVILLISGGLEFIMPIGTRLQAASVKNGSRLAKPGEVRCEIRAEHAER
jgi:hypothetical protein